MRHQASQGVLDAGSRAILIAVAEAAIPAGSRLPAAGPRAVDAVDQFFATLPSQAARAYRGLIHAIDATALLRHRRRFVNLDAAARLDVLEAWGDGSLPRRLALRAVMTPLKVAHFGDRQVYQQLGCVYDYAAKAEARPRFMTERSHALGALDEDLAVTCDVVVVGTGAGGAVVAKELAEAGAAVVLVEEGRYFERTDFNGRPIDLQRTMYRQGGATFSVGNVGIPIPLGVTVGGSTTINSGTCYRVPRRVLREWREQFGLSEFTDEMMATHYDRVESILGVAPAKMEHVGGVGRVIARGCDALGYTHKPLRRNAPDCDGKGICCFGCPTDAKRSTNVSYVPLALRAGAELFHGAKVERIIVEGGRAVGVVARTASRKLGAHRTLTVRARAVVIACGTIMTPILLEQNGLCGGSGQLGRNLSIHPACGSMGVFDEPITAYNAIPQGYAIEEFHEEGILFEGSSVPLEHTMSLMPFVGPRLTGLAEVFDRLAPFGFLVEDTSRGRVRGVAGRPLITYMLNDRDVARLKRGIEILARVFFAAGARRVLSPIHGHVELSGEADIARLERARISAGDLELSAYHPLGTARMGRDPATSVVGADHQAHDVPGLYIIDGASVPSSLGVNPQVTIMAMATRAAGMLADRLS